MRAPTESELADAGHHGPIHTSACDCFHCGEPVPPGSNFSLLIDGVEQPMCCPGCQAVAQLITANGLDQFYSQRTAYSEKPDEDGAAHEQFAIYDEPELADSFSSVDEGGLRRASLLLGGVSCAACTWLIEQSLSRVDGVRSAVVNLQQSRLDVCFDPDTLPMSAVFLRLAELGYQPRPFGASTQREQLESDRRRDLRRLAVAGLGMMQVGMFAVALHAGDIQGIEDRYQALLRWVSLPVAGFVVLYSARPFFESAWRHLRQRSLVMDLPVSLAIGLAFLASVWATVKGSGQVYFDSVVMFTFFLLLGRFMESRMRQRHLFDLVDAESALPPAVSLYREERWQSVPRVRVVAGDRLLVRRGETVPVDARVASGSSAVREDAFNGEHLPRPVTEGDAVYAGTINIEGSLEIIASGDYAQTRLAALQRSVEVAQTEKPRLAQVSDRIASWFVAGILLVSAVTFSVWSQLDPANALWITLSVLVVSCPCALALATPAALTSAASSLRRHGVLVRGENALESLARCSHVLFDKTGTLTEGQLTISRVEVLDDVDRDGLLADAAALQLHSNHPVAKAFANIEASAGFSDVVYEVGAGLEGLCHQHTFRLGSINFCREIAPNFPDAPDAELYWIGMTRDGEPVALIGLDDHLRSGADALVSSLQDNDLQLELVTGDASGQGQKIGQALGFNKVLSGMTPDQKKQHTQDLQHDGAIVAMVGDGLNDAPVLSLADASFAVPGATDLARAQADFIITEGSLQKITLTMDKARHCLKVMYQNFGWALAYNCSAIPLAALGFIPPWAAALGMSFSSLLVVANSLRLNT